MTATTGTVSPYIHIDNLTFDYGGEKPAVDNLSFDIRKGEFIGLLGPSGCGKSTTLRMFAGLISPTSGGIRIGSNDIISRPPWERNLGLVFQNYALFPHMTVNENVAFGLKLRKVAKPEIEARVAEALKVVRLDGFGARKPSQLSGGQQQRVAIARAIVIRPDILLLDEPLSNLDARLRDEMRTELREIQLRTGITTLFVTHDQQEALTMCDRIAIMNGGKLEQIGTPDDVYDRPASRFVADFIGRANALDCESVTGEGGVQLVCAGHAVPVAEPIEAGRKFTAVVRPYAVDILAPTQAGIAGSVSRRIFTGSFIDVEVRLDNGQTLVAEVRPGSSADALCGEGNRVSCTWTPDRTRLFAA